MQLETILLFNIIICTLIIFTLYHHYKEDIVKIPPPVTRIVVTATPSDIYKHISNDRNAASTARARNPPLTYGDIGTFAGYSSNIYDPLEMYPVEE